VGEGLGRTYPVKRKKKEEPRATSGNDKIIEVTRGKRNVFTASRKLFHLGDAACGQMKRYTVIRMEAAALGTIRLLLREESRLEKPFVDDLITFPAHDALLSGC
jgi:hypothetical protein